MTEIEQLTQLCERLGSGRVQAAAMAAQLSKRAGQLAAKRGIGREEALSYLLNLVIKGRTGEPPAGFEGRAGPETRP